MSSSPQANSDGEVIWRFAIEEAEGSVQYEYAVRFKQKIEERTNGEVRVIVYPYGTLGTSTQMTEQLNLGVLEFAMASPGSLGKFIPEIQVFLLHFLLAEDDRTNQRVLSNPDVVERFDSLYAPKGLRLLSIFSEGEMVWTMKKEIRRPEDFSGVKMRIMTTPLLLAAYRAYGASPTPMPYSEVYSGLQLNMIDGQVNPVFAIERQKFHEVTSWMIFPSHAPFITTCAANRLFFDALDQDRQTLVNDVIVELDTEIYEVQKAYQTERLKQIIRDKKQRRATLNISGDLSDFIDALTPAERHALIEDNPWINLTPALSDEEREAFRRASMDVREQFLAMTGPRGKEVLEYVQQAVEAMQKKRAK